MTTTASTATGWDAWSARTWALPGTAPSPASRTAAFDPAIVELDVVPQQVGEPELGDTVVKSGRTTGVTHGIVRRVDTIAKIDYGGTVGLQNIGCFEIGPDPDHPAPADEISRGGDSGSLWMFTQRGQPQTVVAGLHFGGETDSSPDEHALACLPTSVFEKLGISLQPPTAEEVEQVGGLRPRLPRRPDRRPRHWMPALRDDVAVTVDGEQVVEYTHFSLQMKRSRRFAFWVAWNIDGGALKALSRKGIKFVKDRRIPENLQVGDELYVDNDLDRGHLARRADLVCGAACPVREEGEHRLVLLHQHHPPDERLQPEQPRRTSGAGWRMRSSPTPTSRT